MAGSAYSPEEIETIYRWNFTLVYQLCMVLMRSVPDAEDAALTVISCAAGVVSGGDRRLIDCFGGGEQVEELISPVAVDQFHTYENGWTVAISQVLADRLSLAVLVDVTAPEGTALSREERLDLRLDQLDSQGERISSGHPLMGFLRQLEDGDPADNHMTVLWQVRKTEGAGGPSLSGQRAEADSGWGPLPGGRADGFHPVQPGGGRWVVELYRPAARGGPKVR